MTRGHGVVDSAAGLVPFGHLGWGYRDRAEFHTRAAEYIADGLARNQWVEFVGGGTREQLRAELEAIPGISGISDTYDIGDIRVTPAHEFYAVPDGTDVVDPEIAVATRCAAVESAVAAGYSGFRAIVDATSVARTRRQRDAFARFEFLIDRIMAALPVSALCAYDLGQLPEDVQSLICLHPYVDSASPNIRLYAEPGSAFALNGEIDGTNATAFGSALDRIWPLLEPTEIVVDVSGLEFISHQQLVTLDRYARNSGRQIILQTPTRVIARLAELVDLTNIRVQ